MSHNWPGSCGENGADPRQGIKGRLPPEAGMESPLQIPLSSRLSSRRPSFSATSDELRPNKNVSFNGHVQLRTFQASKGLSLLSEESFELVARLDVPVKDISRLVPYKKSKARTKYLSAALRKLLPKRSPTKQPAAITLG